MDWLWLFLWTMLASGAVGFFTSFNCLPYTASPGSGFQVVISGLTSGLCGTECDAKVNGTHALDSGFPACAFSSPGVSCVAWGKDSQISPCEPCMILSALKVGDDYVTRLIINLGWSIGGYVNGVIYEYNHGTTKPDYSAFVSLPLTFVSGGEEFPMCGGYPTATVLVTAIP